MFVAGFHQIAKVIYLKEDKSVQKTLIPRFKKGNSSFIRGLIQELEE